MDPQIIRKTRRFVAGAFVAFNAVMLTLYFAVPPERGDDARLRAVLIFWVGADVVLGGAWLAGRWMLKRISREDT